jgi:hypothetical protein
MYRSRFSLRYFLKNMRRDAAHVRESEHRMTTRVAALWESPWAAKAITRVSMSPRLSSSDRYLEVAHGQMCRSEHDSVVEPAA